MKAVVIHETGDAEKMKIEQIPIPKATTGYMVIKNSFAGLNFIDIYLRSGLYPVPELPHTLGLEGAGTVHELPEDYDQKEFKLNDRVSFIQANSGGYAEYSKVKIDNVVKIPDNVSFEHAVAAMLQGMTAHYLVHSSYPIQKDDWCLIHAGAGGVGILLTQLAKKLGANVITTTSSEEKAKISQSYGADHVILYNKQDFEVEVKKNLS
eukprot:Anaeramoba_ignava/c18566_g1_i2.p1 GENE.c18566_g1_i2~~c18566_g1_i2.p1  ORF type:complete len:224 (+),score=89.67 c18566_g1_i2:49-672(+)